MSTEKGTRYNFFFTQLTHKIERTSDISDLDFIEESNYTYPPSVEYFFIQRNTEEDFELQRSPQISENCVEEEIPATLLVKATPSPNIPEKMDQDTSLILDEIPPSGVPKKYETITSSPEIKQRVSHKSK
jgi:hypothetical protein